MGFRVVLLAEIGSRSRGVEIPEGHHAPAIALGIPLKDVFEDKLGFSVRIHRLLRVVLQDGGSGRRTVDRRGGGKNELLDICAAQGLKKNNSGGDILLKIYP